MNNIKKFLSKNSFIVIFAIAVIIALANFLVYPVLISAGMDYREVPVANTTLPEGTLITDDMIAYLSIPTDNVPQGALLNKGDIVGKFVKENNAIPSNGYFYIEQIGSIKQTFGNVYKELKEGEWAYTLVVPARYCQNNAFSVSQLIDIYFYTEIKEVAEEGDNTFRTYNAPVFGMLAENKRIIGIAAEKGNDAMCLTLACDEEDIGYLKVAEEMGEIFPLVYYGSSGLIEDAKSEIYDMAATRAWLDERSSHVFERDLLERYGLLGVPTEVAIQHIENREDIDDETYNKIIAAINELNSTGTEETEENPTQGESGTPKKEETPKTQTETPPKTQTETNPKTQTTTPKNNTSKTQTGTSSKATSKEKDKSDTGAVCVNCEKTKKN